MKFFGFLLSIFSGLVFAQASFAQKKDFLAALVLSDYDWSEPIVPAKNSNEHKKHSAEYIKNLQILEYFYDRKGNLRLAELVHKVIQINDNKGLQQFNKVYIENEIKGGFLGIKARAVSPSGKITVLNTKNIHKIENGSEYLIFAVEGAEKGGIIEYFYLREKEADLHGEIFLQYSVPAQDVDFQIISPKNLIFSAKSYNGLSQPLFEDKKTYNLLTVKEKNIPAAQFSPHFHYTAHLLRVNYKLQNDYHKGDYQHLSWNDISDQIAASVYEQHDEKTKLKLLEQINDIIKEAKTDEDKIKVFDSYVKNYIRKKSINNDKTFSLETVFSNKVASEPEIIRLYAFFFDALDIDHQLVVTSNRSRCKFDPDFPTWDFVETLFFYFPKLKTYLSPLEKTFSYGTIPYFYTANVGLFIHRVNLGTRAGGTGYTNLITAPALSSIETDFRVSFDKNMQSAEVERKQTLTGAKALIFGDGYSDKIGSSNGQSNKFRKSVFAKSNSAATTETDFLNEPVAFSEKTNSEELSEFAGDRILVKISAFMKDRANMQQNFENEHAEEVELECVEKFKSRIVIEIPEGFMVRNLDRFNRKLTYGTPDKPLTGFKSNAKITDGKIEIEVEEYYNEIIFSKEDLKKYRTVQAASRFFREQVLIFERLER
jgi:hypothetical protein